MKAVKLSNIKFVVFDFDGVFTDNRVFASADGKEVVLCSRADGLGLARLKELSIPSLVISSEPNSVVGVRCRKMGISWVQDCKNKLRVLKTRARKLSVPLSEVCYLGNDLNDVECLEAVGMPVCVADSYTEAKRVSRVILKTKGGHGAVRELCDRLWSSHQRRRK